MDLHDLAGMCKGRKSPSEVNLLVVPSLYARCCPLVHWYCLAISRCPFEFGYKRPGCIETRAQIVQASSIVPERLCDNCLLERKRKMCDDRIKWKRENTRNTRTKKKERNILVLGNWRVFITRLKFMEGISDPERAKVRPVQRRG